MRCSECDRGSCVDTVLFSKTGDAEVLHMALASTAVKEALVMDDESLENIVAVALERIRASLERGTPFMAQRVMDMDGKPVAGPFLGGVLDASR